MATTVYRELVDESFELERMGNALLFQGNGRVTLERVAPLRERYEEWSRKLPRNPTNKGWSGLLEVFAPSPSASAFLYRPIRDEYERGFLSPVRTLRRNLLRAEDAAAGLAPYEGPPPSVSRPSVFVVHGRNEHYLAQTIDALRKLEAEPQVLRQLPNQGRTIIEKFEDHTAEVDFAVVLLTADDIGGLAERGEAGLQPRARQNVIYELAFFHAKLGRGRVCSIVEHGVEAPSDYDGVVYVPLDEVASWKVGLGRELRAAGFRVRLSRLAS